MRITIIILILGIVLSRGVAQVPDSPEDVSPLLISEKIPEVNVQDINGTMLAISDVIKDNRSVFLFYRGGWCPYCNAHLSAVGEVEEDIIALGYQVIAISPDSPGKLRTTVEKEELTYSLYSDASGNLMKAMGIAFKAPDRYEKRLANYSDGQNPGIIPVPSLFVVETDGTILFEYINPDYKHRISADMLISVLRHLGED